MWLAVAALAALLCAAGGARGEELRVLVLADVHYDPLFVPGAPRTAWCRGEGGGSRDAPYGRYGCDSAPLLANATIDAAAGIAVREKADLVLLLGDLPGHMLPSLLENREATRAVLRRLMAGLCPPDGQTASSSRAPPVLALLGNNEGYPNYNLSLDPWDPQLRELLDIYRGEGLDVPDEFLEAGRYTYDLEPENREVNTTCGQGDNSGDAEDSTKQTVPASRKIRIVALNTLYYSVRYTLREDAGEDPLGQFAWLSGVLAGARKERTPVLVVAHLPPGVNAFTGAENLADRFSRRLAEILGEYSDVVSAALYGHYHHEQLKLYDALRWNSVPAVVCPSVSPNSYNNPGFLLAEFAWAPGPGGTTASQLRLRDYRHYSADLEECNMHGNASFSLAYRFSEAYRGALRDPGGVSGRNVRALLLGTIVDGRLMRRYSGNARSGYAAGMRQNLCAVESANRLLYHECLEGFSWP